MRWALSARSAAVDAALHDAEQRLVGRGRCAGPRPARPSAAVRSTASRTTVGRRRQRRADVEHHLDVGAEQLLDARPPTPGVRWWVRAVVGRAEGGAVVVDLGLEREDLVAARVGEREAVPVGEPAEPAERGDHLGARAQHQVVGVAEHDLGAEVARGRPPTGACTAPRVPTGMKHGVR